MYANCDKKCDPCHNCYDLDLERVLQTTHSSHFALIKQKDSEVCVNNWGYSSTKSIDNLTEDFFLIDFFLQSYIRSVKCGYDFGLCPEEVNAVLEFSNLKFEQKDIDTDVIINDEKLDLWVLENPYCRSWEDWEQCVKRACPKIGLKVVDITEACKFIVDFKTISTDIKLKSKIAYTLSVITEAKNKKCFDVNIKNLSTCKYDYEIIVNKYPDCKLNFSTYVSLLNCHFSYETISSLLECGIKVDYNIEKSCPTVYVNNKTYNLNNLGINLFSKRIDQCYLDSALSVSKEECGTTFIETLTKSYDNLELINI